MTSGSNFTCIDALAGQISVTPLTPAAFTPFESDRLMKNASSDISSLYFDEQVLVAAERIARVHQANSFRRAAGTANSLPIQPSRKRVWKAARATASSSASA